MGNDIRFRALLKDEVSGKLAKMRDQFDRLGKSKGAATVLQGVGMGMGISAWGALSGAISGTVDWLAKGVRGAIEEEAGIARLTASLRANVPAWDGNTEAIERSVGAATKMGYADDEIRDSLAKLVPATHNVARAFEVQQTAMDLARFKGISLADATQALVKVEAGQYRALKGLGIVLREGASQTEALAAVQKVAGGQAKAYLETTAGKTEMLGIKFDELGEKAGALASGPLSDLADAAIEVIDAIGGTGPSVTEDVAADMYKASNAAEALGDAFSNLLDHFTPWDGYVDAALERQRAALAAVDYEAAKSWDTYAEGVDAMRHLGDAADDTRKPLGRMEKAVLGNVDAYKDLNAWIDTVAQQLAGDEIGAATAEFNSMKLELRLDERALEDVTAQIERLKDRGKPVPLELKQKFEDLKGEVIDDRTKVAQLGLKLEDIGGIKMTDLLRQLERLGIRLDADTEKALRLRDAMDLGTGYDNQGRGERKGGNRASGGPVLPGHTYTVGESGRETLVMGVGGGGYVIPNRGGGGGGGGSPVVISLQLDGREIARAVDRQLYYEAARAPQSATAG